MSSERIAVILWYSLESKTVRWDWPLLRWSGHLLLPNGVNIEHVYLFIFLFPNNQCPQSWGGPPINNQKGSSASGWLSGYSMVELGKLGPSSTTKTSDNDLSPHICDICDGSDSISIWVWTKPCETFWAGTCTKKVQVSFLLEKKTVRGATRKLWWQVWNDSVGTVNIILHSLYVETED